MARYGTSLVWLALMPVGCYGTETGPGGGSVLYRFVPLIRRQRGALAVPMAVGQSGSGDATSAFANRS